MSTVLVEIAAALESGDGPLVRTLADRALREGLSAGAILQDGLLTGMNTVGKRFKANEIYMPEVLLAARAMHAGIGILEPHLGARAKEGTRKVVLGTVKGDLHDIGKNLVAIMLRGAGYQVVDLGVDVDTARFVAAVKEHEPVALGLSALLTTTMLHMKEVIHALEGAALRKQVTVLVGGAPVTQAFASEIGADGYCENAYGAVEVLKGSGYSS